MFSSIIKRIAYNEANVVKKDSLLGYSASKCPHREFTVCNTFLGY